MKWLKHAFALDPPGPAQPTESERAVLERLCQELVRRHLDGVALVALESCRPLNYLGAQVLHVIAPLAGVLVSSQSLRQLAGFLERRGSIDYLCARIEELRHEQTAGADAGAQPASTAAGSKLPESSCPPSVPHEP